MLVLSRKEEQKILFPALGISLEILHIKGSTVRVGIDAPMEVRIVRDELVDGTLDEQINRLPPKLRHEFRNELNSISIASQLFKQEMECGNFDDAAKTFDKLVQRLNRVSKSKLLAGKLPSGSFPSRRLSSPAVTANKPLRALVVEDEANEREMLAGFLRLQGYQVDTAADGDEAFEYLQANVDTAIVLVDMRMPRCDGPTAIRRIRENRNLDQVKIFAISGSPPEENQSASEDVNGWFMKPLNPQLLIESLPSNN